MAATVTTLARPGDDVDPGGPPSATTLAEGRGRYLDTLVAVALIGIVTFHQFGWHWLPLAFPSMGVLFAVAGSRVAGGLTQARGNYWTVVYDRSRRLLLPVWRISPPGGPCVSFLGHARRGTRIGRPKWLQIVGSLGYLCAAVPCCSRVLPSWPQHS